ncbi:MAG: lysine--tRNA ligase [bacterium]|nr:lysine--tRNA ligase [bacterium]
MFWADIVAKETKRKEPILVNDAKTPSGKVHVGSLRGVLIHDFVYKSLLKLGKKARYTYHFDDFDPMDGLPIYLDKEKYEKYMGFPLKDVPSPQRGYTSYADYYAKDFLKVFNSLGAEPEIVWSYKDMYASGRLDQAIKIVLDKAPEIQEIYQRVSGSEKKKDWFPFQPVCENCGRIGTTRVYFWDGKQVSYVCEKDMVEWAVGCGYEGKVSPFGGKGKMPWKVEWPSKWLVNQVGFEGSGKDHTSKGGSRDIGNHIAREIFKIEPPEDLAYEHFLFGGKKMSSSKGLGASAAAVAEVLPASVLRFLNARYHPRVAIDFDPTHSDTIPNLFDEYDRAREAYFADPESDLGRTFEAGHIGKPVKVFIPRFITLANWLRQPNINIEAEAEKAKGSGLTKEDKEDLDRRARYAKIWLERFAKKEQRVIEVKEQEKLTFSERVKKYFKDLDRDLDKDWTEEELQKRIFQIAKENDLQPKEAFTSTYQALIGDDHGPKVSALIISDKSKARKALKKQYE